MSGDHFSERLLTRLMGGHAVEAVYLLATA